MKTQESHKSHTASNAVCFDAWKTCQNNHKLNVLSDAACEHHLCLFSISSLLCFWRCVAVFTHFWFGDAKNSVQRPQHKSMWHMYVSCGPLTLRMRSLCGTPSSIFVLNGLKARRVDIPSHAHAYVYMLMFKRIVRIQALKASTRPKTPPRKDGPRKARVPSTCSNKCLLLGCAVSSNIREIVRTHAYTTFTWYLQTSGYALHNSTHSTVTHSCWCTAGTATAKTDRHEGLSRATACVKARRPGVHACSACVHACSTIMFACVNAWSSLMGG